MENKEVLNDLEHDSIIRDDISLYTDLSKFLNIDNEIFTKEQTRSFYYIVETRLLVIVKQFDQKQIDLWNQKLKQLKDIDFENKIRFEFKNNSDNLSKILSEQEWNDDQKQIIYKCYIDTLGLLNHRGLIECKKLIESKIITDNELIIRLLNIDLNKLSTLDDVGRILKIEWYLPYTKSIEIKELLRNNINMLLIYSTLDDILYCKVINKYTDIWDEPFLFRETSKKLLNDFKDNLKFCELVKKLTLE
jgi:hypothetical protein